MGTPFEYSDEEWEVVETCLTQLRKSGDTPRDTPPVADDRGTLETIINNFVWLTERTDPRHPEVVATKEQWSKVKKHIAGLNAALAELDAMRAKPMRGAKLAMTRNGDPREADGGFAAWRTQTTELEHWAGIGARGWPVSMRPGRNRARGDLVDQLIGELLSFWHAHGGDYGQSTTSPSTEFVLIAVAPVLPEMAASTVTEFVRPPRARARSSNLGSRG
jgi:hypothetical protein